MNPQEARALNVLIAEKVMRWHKWVDWEKGDYDGLFPMFADFSDMALGVAFYEEPGDPAAYYDFITRIADAWLVVEEMQNLEYSVRINWSIGTLTWEASFRYTGRPWLERKLAPTAPEAICLAAIETVR